jgi:hypothetical protein
MGRGRGRAEPSAEGEDRTQRAGEQRNKRSQENQEVGATTQARLRGRSSRAIPSLIQLRIRAWELRLFRRASCLACAICRSSSRRVIGFFRLGRRVIRRAFGKTSISTGWSRSQRSAKLWVAQNAASSASLLKRGISSSDLRYRKRFWGLLPGISAPFLQSHITGGDDRHHAVAKVSEMHHHVSVSLCRSGRLVATFSDPPNHRMPPKHLLHLPLGDSLGCHVVDISVILVLQRTFR